MSSASSSRALIVSVGTAIVGTAVMIVGLMIAPRALAASYLTAYSATVAVAVGMLLLLMIAHLSGAVWFVILRRHAETVAGALPMLALLAVPLVLVPRAFWPWAAPLDSLPPVMQQALRPKLAYFQPAFFTLRAALYWVVWLGLGEALRRRPSRMTRLSAAGIPLAGLALTFASIDWMMSVAPDWSSSVYGPYVGAGAIVGALALLAVLAAVASGGAWVPTPEHFQAVGRLTLAFLLFWAYLWYAQFFIIWIADVPHEVTWYVIRFGPGWGVLGRVVVVTGFVVPFVILAFRAARGSALLMTAVGVWLLVASYLDVYWLIVPSIRPGTTIADVIWDVAALALVVGSTVACAVWRQAPVPVSGSTEAAIRWSLRYQAH